MTVNHAKFILVALLIIVLGIDLAAQDRVILFESSRIDGTVVLPGEIREIEVTQGGRGWSVRHAVAIPAHTISGVPVAIADGSRIVWLAMESRTSPAPTVLAQYDMATARASIIDIGRFEPGAFIVADPHAARIFIVESQRIVVVDAQLSRREILVASSKRIVDAALAGGRLFVHRRTPAQLTGDDELVIVNVESAVLERSLALGGTRRVVVRRDGQRYYRAYYDPQTADHKLDLVSVTNGELIARRPNTNPGWLLTIDETRNIILFDESTSGGMRFITLNADTLAPSGQFAPGQFSDRRQFAVTETATERTVIVFSREIVPGYFDACETSSPRIDVFDGMTFEFVHRMDLKGRCPMIIPIPRQ